MEDEIDLREYIRVLVRHWRLIVGLTVLAAVMAGAVSFLMPRTYEAVTLVSVAEPRYTLRLAGDSQGTAPLPFKAYPDLALSDNVVSKVFSQLNGVLPAKVDTLDKFRQQLTATLAADPSLLRLAVRDTDPSRTARIANTWAQVFTTSAGRLYNQDAATLENYQQQLSTAKTSLANADQALVDFQTINQTAVISVELSSKQTVLKDFLDRLHQLDLVKQDAQNLLDRLAKRDPAELINVTDDLALLSLSERALGLDGNQTPFQVQISSGQSLSGRTVAEQVGVINALVESMQTRETDMDAQVTALRPEILGLQGQLAEAQGHEDDLMRARDLAETQYLSLANKVEEAKIAVQESASVVQLVSEATTPTQPVSPRKLLNTLLGGGLGLLASVFVVFVREWWRAAAPGPTALLADASHQAFTPEVAYTESAGRRTATELTSHSD